MAPRRIALLASGAVLSGLTLVPNPFTAGDRARPFPATAGVERHLAEASAAATHDAVPNVALIDQDGRSIRVHEFAGRIVVLTFLYTRCPMPEFCPLIVSNLERVRRRANDTGIGERVAFVGVTLDPEFDTPPVLREYGKAKLKGRKPFEQWTLATGSPRQIADLARVVGLDYRPEDGIIVHTLMTAVIGVNGRIVRTFPSNAWRPDELFDAVRQATERGRTH